MCTALFTESQLKYVCIAANLAWLWCHWNFTALFLSLLLFLLLLFCLLYIRKFLIDWRLLFFYLMIKCCIELLFALQCMLPSSQPADHFQLNISITFILDMAYHILHAQPRHNSLTRSTVHSVLISFVWTDRCAHAIVHIKQNISKSIIKLNETNRKKPRQENRDIECRRRWQ